MTTTRTTQSVRLALTPAEHRKLKAAAATAGLTQTEYLTKTIRKQLKSGSAPGALWSQEKIDATRGPQLRPDGA